MLSFGPPLRRARAPWRKPAISYLVLSSFMYYYICIAIYVYMIIMSMYYYIYIYIERERDTSIVVSLLFYYHRCIAEPASDSSVLSL